MPSNAPHTRTHPGWLKNDVVAQAVVRMLFGCMFTAYSYVVSAQGIFGAPPISLFYAGATFVVLAAFFLAIVIAIESDNSFFKTGGMVLDIIFASITMILGGSAMAFLYGIYLWIIIGNGLRFGRKYMFRANIFSLIGFSLVLGYSDFWQEYAYIGGGLMLWLLLMPIYIGKLLSKLEFAVEMADKANKAKSQFLANMSHEIRTPLTAIIGFSETALDKDQMNEQRLDALATIRQSGNHLLNLVNDILDFSKIDAGELEIEKIAMNPVQIMIEVETIIRVQAEKKSLAFNVEYHFPLPTLISSDPVRLKQILLNLCSNAIKFTERGSISIKLAYHADEHVMEFIICDTGIGMKPDDLEKVFKPFKQADSSTTRKYGGTGLGLSLSRQLSQLLDGELTVESTYQVGTVFKLRIPCGDKPSEMINGMLDIQRPERGQGRETNHTLTGTILLVEDNVLNQRLIKTYLEKMGALVTIANNGREACELALKNDFDLVYMDMQMPEMSGVDATLYLRAQNYSVPVVALTANATKLDRQLCKQSGFDEFVTKPIVRDKLYEITARYLRPAIATNLAPNPVADR